MTLEARFWSKVDVRGPEECWPWLASTARGYGQFAIHHGNLTRAHRFSWSIVNGPVPEGLWILHHCDNRVCVNPAHLYAGDVNDNARDVVVRRRHWAHRGEPVTVGEKNGRAKLTRAQVDVIRDRHTRGESQSALAREYGVVSQMVNRIVNGKAWA